MHAEKAELHEVLVRSDFARAGFSCRVFGLKQNNTLLY
jgi:hypothetical protein